MTHAETRSWPGRFFRDLPLFRSKELRIIAPALFAGILFVLSAAVLAPPYQGAIFSFAYPLVCASIVSLAFGHDFTYNTFASSLAQPVERKEVWRVRMVVSALAVLPIAILVFCLRESITLGALLTGREVYFQNAWYSSFGLSAAHVLIPAVAALSLGPWLTIVSRSPLFGTVMAAGAPFCLSIITGPFARLIGVGDEHVDWWHMGVQYLLFAIGFVVGRRQFMTLEALDSNYATETRSPAKAKVGHFLRATACAQLLKKEMMLQRAPVLLALAALAIAVLLEKDKAILWSAAYPPLLMILFGSVASADERQLGTTQWNATLPFPYWKQWSVKVFITWATALIFGEIFPGAVLLWKTHEPKNQFGDLLEIELIFTGAAFLFTTITLYVSSLCSSSVKAVIYGLIVNAVVIFSGIQLAGSYGNLVWRRGITLSEDRAWPQDDLRMIYDQTGPVPAPIGSDWVTATAMIPFWLAVAGLLFLTLRFAMQNHRDATRGTRMLLRQVFYFAVYEFAAIAVIVTFWNYYDWLR